MVVPPQPAGYSANVPEALARCPVRGVSRESAGLEVARSHLEVKLELLVHIGGDIGAKQAAVPPPHGL
jgi:hypothetical protein